jgi:hypothetical protein
MDEALMGESACCPRGGARRLNYLAARERIPASAPAILARAGTRLYRGGSQAIALRGSFRVRRREDLSLAALHEIRWRSEMDKDIWGNIR